MALINPLLYLQFVPLWSHKVLQDIVQHGYQPVYQCGDNTWPATGNNRSNAAAGSEVKRGGGEGEREGEGEGEDHLLVSMVIMASAWTVFIARKFLFLAIMEASFSLSRC